MMADVITPPTGTPRLFRRPRYAGALPCFANEYSMREFAYRPELYTLITAVRHTKFRMPAAACTPTESKICTNGLELPSIVLHGTTAMITPSAQM